MAGYDMGSVQWALGPFNLKIAATGRTGQIVVPLVHTPTAFGGERDWLQCACGRRCRIIYRGSYGDWRCRQCFRLAYPSQREDIGRRKLRRADNIVRRMGADPQEWEFPPKPRRMHWRTYHRLENQVDELRSIADSAGFLRACRIIGLK